jgi:xylulokinase
VMEGVTFGLMDGLQAMQGESTAGPALALVGGGARSNRWAQMIASSLGRTLLRDEGAQAAAALGAARLGWMAAGGTKASVCLPLQNAVRFEPDAREAWLLQERHHRFRSLYPVLQPWFEKAGGDAASAGQ